MDTIKARRITKALNIIPISPIFRSGVITIDAVFCYPSMASSMFDDIPKFLLFMYDNILLHGKCAVGYHLSSFRPNP